MEIQKLTFLVLNHIYNIHIHSEVDKFDATRDGIKSSWSMRGMWECGAITTALPNNLSRFGRPQG
jgi:hypothetical protein